MTDLFDQQPTLERRNESYDSLQPAEINSQLKEVIKYLKIHPLSSSRSISNGTGIERTSICRTLASNKKYFNDEMETIDKITNKRVTLYQLNKTL